MVTLVSWQRDTTVVGAKIRRGHQERLIVGRKNLYGDISHT